MLKDSFITPACSIDSQTMVAPPLWLLEYAFSRFTIGRTTTIAVSICGVVPEYGWMRGSLLHSCMPSYLQHLAALRHCSLTFGAMLKCCAACEYRARLKGFGQVW